MWNIDGYVSDVVNEEDELSDVCEAICLPYFHGLVCLFASKMADDVGDSDKNMGQSKPMQSRPRVDKGSTTCLYSVFIMFSATLRNLTLRATQDSTVQLRIQCWWLSSGPERRSWEHLGPPTSLGSRILLVLGRRRNHQPAKSELGLI